MLTDSSEAQEAAAAAKFGEQIIHPALLKAKERVRKWPSGKQGKAHDNYPPYCTSSSQ